MTPEVRTKVSAPQASVTQKDEPADTRSAILDIAERLVQRRGFNDFSYADIATELGVTKAALHYHFPGKAELGEELLTRYTARFAQALSDIEASSATAASKLKSYAQLYLGVLRDERMCLCGMLAAEYRTLPPPMQSVLLRFFDDNHDWLERLLQEGRADGSLGFRGRSSDAAQMILGSLEGAMLVARTYGDTSRFEMAADQLLAEFAGEKPQATSR